MRLDLAYDLDLVASALDLAHDDLEHSAATSDGSSCNSYAPAAAALDLDNADAGDLEICAAAAAAAVRGGDLGDDLRYVRQSSWR